MGGVQSLFSAETDTKTTLTTDDINNEIQSFVRELTERDRKLFNYAKKEISKEASKLNILNAKICIEFHDREVCVISKGGEEIGGQCIRIVMDNDGECTTVWEKQWFCRRVCQTVINADLTPVKNIAITYLPALIAFGMRQMGWRQT